MDASYNTDLQRTRILASFVPDEILYNISDYTIRKYEVVLVLGDVSGFTDLSEKYNKEGSGGPSRLTQILNNYIGSMVQEIMRHNGDLLKFSGDAFLAMWKCGKDKSIRDIVSQVLRCSIIIQRNYGRYYTDIGVTLGGIATGSGFFSIIGDDKTKHYVILGKCVEDVKLAEHSCTAGEVMLSPSAWKYVNPMEYNHEYHSDRKHVKITGCGETWREGIKIEDDTGDTGPEDDTAPQDDVITMYSDRAGPSTQVDISTLGKKKQKEFSLRPSVEVSARKKMKDAMRPFIFPVVMKWVDMGEPLDYLTEMRQVVIMFLNIIPYEKDWETLIGLVNQTYKIVCSSVAAAQGCVNKLSFFDKDLMMLIIFGLRGYKHEFEIQNALMCATEARLACKGLEGVRNASIGVTTGMAYCGVVGHVLRREYTVIGVPVNKGARLMVAYPGKVTCDREVFLHSKLDARHFVLQEPKPLKGLHNVGPIYEFKEKTLGQGISIVSKYPLLGRSMELDLFKQMVDNLSTRKSNTSRKDVDIKNVLVMNGEPRIGKTRLLDEMLYSVQGKAMIHKVSLSHGDSKTPYKTMQLIFTPTMGTPDKTSAKDREDKINKLSVLQDQKYSKWICCLNAVFNVNFELSKEYQKGTLDEKRKGLESVLSVMLQTCFRQTWVCGIDNCEFMDESSWLMFRAFIETDSVLFVMTYGLRRYLPDCGIQLIDNHPRIRTLEITGIDKWFYAGLACQIIDVKAIPPELEKIIQIRSNGNPGWIESYMMSMIQGGGVIIHDIPVEDVLKLGLVYPPEEMMVRISDDLRGREARVTVQDTRDDNWKLYASCFKESNEQIPIGKRKDGKMKVCEMTSEFHIEDADTSVTIDAMILQVYDDLTSFEQLVLKCSCVMGDVFPRTMLIYIMNKPSQELRNLARAVKKLFERRVIGCAKGDFSQGDFVLCEQQTSAGPMQNNEIGCDCKGLSILDCCKDLPKYASCGLMKFLIPLFRETTYTLLLDNQRKEFHLRAAKFIEKETRRCKSCGGTMFTNILRGFGQEVREFRIRDKRVVVEEDVTIEIIDETPSIDETFDKMQRSLGIEPPTIPVESRIKIGEIGDDKASQYTTKCFIPCSKRVESATSLTETYSSLNFAQCQCILILTTMYTFLLHHYRGAGNYDKVVDLVLEFAPLTIALSNHPTTLTLLEEANNIIEARKLSDDVLHSWRIPYMKGRIHVLRGQSFLERDCFADASKELYTAMTIYGYYFPRHNIYANVRIMYQGLQLRTFFDIMPNLAFGRSKGYYAKIADEIADCLSLFFNLFKVTDHWRLAKLAAIWGLNKALQSNTNFSNICTALSNLLTIATHYGDVNDSIKIENYAIEIMQANSEKVIESEQLRAISQMYFSILIHRILRADIIHAVSVGHKTLTILDSSDPIYGLNLKIKLLPYMITLYLLRQHISECIFLLSQLDHAAMQKSDKSAQTWYFALCLTFQLETGFSFVPFAKCEQYFKEQGESMLIRRNPSAKKRYFICMWLWCMRNEEWEAATIWESHIDFASIMNKRETITNIISLFYLLEGKLLYAVGKLDMRDVPRVNKCFKELDILVKHIADACQIIKTGLPRFHILNALYRHIRHNDIGAIKHLMKAKYVAQKQGNLLDLQWSEHTEKVWTGTIPAIFKDFWKDHCQPSNLLDWQEGVTGNMVMFSFPIPKHMH